MASTDWFESNLAAIRDRVAFLSELRDGVIHECPGTMHDLLIFKKGTVLELHFHPGWSQEVLSDFDFARPLYLVAGFTQAMMLGLLWRPQPERVYVLGFGAGRVPMVLHHHFPQIRVESTDIDKDVVDVARQYFGILTDPRLLVAVQDGRDYLAQRAADVRYDLIMSDAFTGVGYSPPPVGTQEFYELCHQHLVDEGAVVVNLLKGDFLFRQKLKALVESFANVYFVPVPEDGTIVLFATQAARIATDELVARAKSLETLHGFTFPFLQRAMQLQHVAESAEVNEALENADALTDATVSQVRHPPRDSGRQSGLPPPPWTNLDTTPFADSDTVRRVGRNEACPCGSGKKYKKCHGRR
jgi:spermidine synthase